MGSIPGLGRSLGEGNGNLLQYSCLRNPTLVANSPTRLSHWACMHALACHRLFYFPKKRYIPVLSPSTCKCDLTWKQRFCRLFKLKWLSSGTYLVVPWLSTHLTMQKMQVQSLIRERDPTCPGATKPTGHNYWSPHNPKVKGHKQKLLVPRGRSLMRHLRPCAVLSRLVVSDSFRPHGLYPARLLCPWRFSRQGYWRRFPSPLPTELPNPRIEPRSPALQADSLPSEPQGKPNADPI